MGRKKQHQAALKCHVNPCHHISRIKSFSWTQNPNMYVISTILTDVASMLRRWSCGSYNKNCGEMLIGDWFFPVLHITQSSLWSPQRNGPVIDILFSRAFYGTRLVPNWISCVASHYRVSYRLSRRTAMCRIVCLFECLALCSKRDTQHSVWH